MTDEKEFYIKEVNVYQVFAKNKQDAINKIKNKLGVHQYTTYHKTY